MNRLAWLQEVKAGDVVYRDGGYSNTYIKHVVTKVTAAQIVCGAIRFRRDNGLMLGAAGFSRPYLVEPTKRIQTKVRVDEIQSELSELIRNDGMVPANLWFALGEVLERHKAEQNQPAPVDQET